MWSEELFNVSTFDYYEAYIGIRLKGLAMLLDTCTYKYEPVRRTINLSNVYM